MNASHRAAASTFIRVPIAIAFAALAASAASAGDDLDDLIADEFVVCLGPGTSLESVLAALAPMAPGLEVEDQIPNRPIHRLGFDLKGTEPPLDLELALEAMVLDGTLVWSEFGYEAQTG